MSDPSSASVPIPVPGPVRVQEDLARTTSGVLPVHQIHVPQAPAEGVAPAAPLQVQPERQMPYPPVAPPLEEPRRNVFQKYWKAMGAGSLLVSLLIHAGLLIAAVFIVQTIVHEQQVDFLPGGGSKSAESAQQNLAQQVQVKKRNAFQQKMPMQRLVSESATATIQLPDVPVDSVDLPEMASLLSAGGGMSSGGFGSAGAGGGLGSGIGSGSIKGMVSFFGLSAPLERVVFVLDYSVSMKPNQLDLVVQEMGKTLKLLPPKAEYQVVLFAGGARFASEHWDVNTKHKYDRIVTHRKRKEFRFFSPTESYMDYAFDGDDDELPKDRWLTANSYNTKKTMENLEQKKIWGGTDWRWGFKVALNMDPPPKVIYFMTDGLMDNADKAVEDILAYNKDRKANSQFNTLLMNTSAGLKNMMKLAKDTSGRCTMVFNDGSSIDGGAYLADKKKYDEKLKEAK